MAIYSSILFVLLVHGVFGGRPEQRALTAFKLTGQSTQDVGVYLPPIAGGSAPFTLDLSFKVDSIHGRSFRMMEFDIAGIAQSSNTLSPVSFPFACDLTTSFAAGVWHQVSISVTGAGNFKYALNLATVCWTSSLLPSASLN